MHTEKKKDTNQIALTQKWNHPPLDIIIGIKICNSVYAIFSDERQSVGKSH